MRTSSAFLRFVACAGVLFAILWILPIRAQSRADGQAQIVNRLDRLIDSRSFGGGMGVNVHLQNYRPGDNAAIAQAGFHLVRTDLLWAQVETVHGRYDWRPYDSLINDLRAHHLVPLMILAYSNPIYAPRLLGHPHSDSLAYAPPVRGAARAAYMAFAKAAALRYGPSVIWEIWNEPDHNFGDPVDLRSFVGFALEACNAIRAVAPDAAVIGPAASGFVWWFLTALQKSDTSGCLDAISVHPYRDEAPESVLQDWARARAMIANCATTPRCPALVDSEWGYSVTGGAWTERRQADYNVRLRLLDMIAGVKLTIIYDWRNDSPNPADKEANFGLLNFHNAPKPALQALTNASRSLQGLHYIGSLTNNLRGDHVLQFGQSDTPTKIVAWSMNPGMDAMSLINVACREALMASASAASPAGPCTNPIGVDKQVRLSETPVYIDLDSFVTTVAKRH